MRDLSKRERQNLFYVLALAALLIVTTLIPGWTGVYL